MPAQDRPAEANAERIDMDMAPPRREVVPEFMEENEHTQHRQERHNGSNRVRKEIEQNQTPSGGGATRADPCGFSPGGFIERQNRCQIRNATSGKRRHRFLYNDGDVEETKPPRQKQLDGNLIGRI